LSVHTPRRRRRRSILVPLALSLVLAGACSKSVVETFPCDDRLCAGDEVCIIEECPEAEFGYGCFALSDAGAPQCPDGWAPGGSESCITGEGNCELVSCPRKATCQPLAQYCAAAPNCECLSAAGCGYVNSVDCMDTVGTVSCSTLTK
jgi:hypothetical protein